MIESERLIYREIEESDFEAIAEIMRGEKVRKVWEHFFTDEDVKEWIARRRKCYADNGIDYLLAVRRDNGEAVGQIGLLKELIEGREVWGIGYILREDCYGKGYATEGARAMADYAFRVMNIPGLVCDIRPMNTASVAVAKRIGMTETGSFIKKYRGMDMEHLIFELENGKKGK